MSKFSEEYTIRGCDVNAEYKITPAALCGYFQECFARYCTVKNLAAFDIILKDIIWVISDIHIDFFDPIPFWGEQIRVEVWCSEIKKLRLYLDFRIYSGNRLITQGDSCWFIIDTKTRRPQKVEEIVKNFEVKNELIFGEHKRINLKEFGNKQSEKIHNVGISDLDFNYHVNNLVYAKIAFSQIDENYLKKHSLKSYKVTYYKESFLHDKWICQLFQQNDEFYHKFIRESDGELLCAIKSEWKLNLPDNRNVRTADFNIKNIEHRELCTV